MLTFPPSLEKIILSHIKETYWNTRKTGGGKKTPFNDRDLKFFASGVAELSDLFTTERGGLKTNYLSNPVLHSGYLLYFLPVNILKIMHVMSELKPSELTNGKIRILDVGSGPGTCMLGMMTYFAEQVKKGVLKEAWLEFTLLDHSYKALKDAAFFHQEYKEVLEKSVKGFHSTVSTLNFDLRRTGLSRFLRDFQYHYVVASNVLNELDDRGAQADLVADLLQHHVDPAKGRLILIEPALKKTSRDLQSVRDEVVVNRKIGFVHAPCLHQHMCPLNVVNKRDWCHFYFSWDAPKFIEKLDRIVGLNKEWLNCSYLILGPQPRDFAQIYKKPEWNWRMISNLMSSKGKREVVLCGTQGRIHLTRLDRNKSPTNTGFDRLRRGDVVEFPADLNGHTADGLLEVGARDVVRLAGTGSA